MASSFPAPLRVSAVQCSIHWNDVPANLQLIESLVRDHAAKSNLIIFPETITTGFSSEAAKLLTESKAKSTKPSSDSLTSTMSLLLGAI